MTGTCQIKLNDVLMFRQSNLKMFIGNTGIMVGQFWCGMLIYSLPNSRRTLTFAVEL